MLYKLHIQIQCIYSYLTFNQNYYYVQLQATKVKLFHVQNFKQIPHVYSKYTLLCMGTPWQ